MCYNKLVTVERGQKIKDWNDEILAFDLVFLARIARTLI